MNEFNKLYYYLIDKIASRQLKERRNVFCVRFWLIRNRNRFDWFWHFHFFLFEKKQIII